MSVTVYRIEIKAKIPFCGVDTSNMPIGYTDIYIEIYYFNLNMISVSHGFCVFNRVAR